jgi:hypothetical protein
MNLKRRLISVDENTYQTLKNLGHTGDSFNQVIKIILDRETGNKLVPKEKLCKFAGLNKRSRGSTTDILSAENSESDDLGHD